jgi:hypothetical protein
VTFDPFGDFATRGYLRNLAKAKDPDIVRRLQHNSFMTGLDEAVLGDTRDPELKMRYEAQQMKRKQAKES